MATFQQLQDFDTTPLDDLEKEVVRQIIGISGKAGTATYIESNTRMSALTASQNQVVRGILLDYDGIGLDTLSVSGGQKGANYSAPRDREALASELRRILYPSASNDDPGTSTFTTMGAINVVPVTYLTGDQDNFS